MRSGDGRDGVERPRSERLEKFRKMRLIEVLGLREEESVRFFCKTNGHEEKVRDLMKSRNLILDDIEKTISEKGTPEELAGHLSG